MITNRTTLRHFSSAAANMAIVKGCWTNRNMTLEKTNLFAKCKLASRIF